jgi:hypothetical protein
MIGGMCGCCEEETTARPIGGDGGGQARWKVLRTKNERRQRLLLPVCVCVCVCERVTGGSLNEIMASALKELCLTN